MEEEERYDNMLMALGLALGSLRDPVTWARMVARLREGSLSRRYVESFVEILSGVLEEAKP